MLGSLGMAKQGPNPNWQAMPVCVKPMVVSGMLRIATVTPRKLWKHGVVATTSLTAAAWLTATLTCGLQCCGRHLNGFADRPPVRPNMSLGDTLAGLHAAFGVVMALLHRQRNQNKVPGQVCLLPHHVVHTMFPYEACHSF